MKTAFLVPPIFIGTIGNESAPCCSARDLHLLLESQQEFPSWIQNAISEYGYIEGEDYFTNVSSWPDGTVNDRPTSDIEWYITLMMASALVAIEGSNKKRKILGYFARQIFRHSVSLTRSGVSVPNSAEVRHE